VTLAQFMVIVDFTIMQVALLKIGREFGVSVNAVTRYVYQAISNNKRSAHDSNRLV
jgi:hypothetical protein